MKTQIGSSTHYLRSAPPFPGTHSLAGTSEQANALKFLPELKLAGENW